MASSVAGTVRSPFPTFSIIPPLVTLKKYRTGNFFRGHTLSDANRYGCIPTICYSSMQFSRRTGRKLARLVRRPVRRPLGRWLLGITGISIKLWWCMVIHGTEGIYVTHDIECIAYVHSTIRRIPLMVQWLYQSTVWFIALNETET